MKQPGCSIVIPTRDCLAYLPTTFATIDLQQRDDLEVVLVDDGSSDGTADWARNRRGSTFSLTVLETGGVGPARARNLGVEAAKSLLIAFLDADDVWWPNKLDRQLAYHAAHPETGLSFTNYIHVTPDGRTTGTCFDYWRCPSTNASDGSYFAIDAAEAKILGSNIVGTSTVVVDRELFRKIGGFLSEWPSAEDWDLWLRLAAEAPVACSTAVTMSYLMRPGSETTNRQNRIAALRAIAARYESRREKEMVAAFRRAQARVAVGEAELARATGDPASAAASHLKALVAAPDWRTLRALASDLTSIPTYRLRTTTVTQ